MAHSLAKLYQRHQKARRGEGGNRRSSRFKMMWQIPGQANSRAGMPPSCREPGLPSSLAVSADPCWPSLSLHGCISVWVTAGGPAQEKQEKACEESNSLSRYPCGCLYWSVTVWRHFISSYFRILTLKWNSFFPTWHFQAGFLPHSPMTAAAISWGWRTWRWVP